MPEPNSTQDSPTPSGGMLRFDSIPAQHERGPSSATGAFSRNDPYWDARWIDDTECTWSTRARSVNAMGRGRSGKLRASHSISPAAARDALIGPGVLAQRYRQVMAAPLMWRTCTAEQIAAIVGKPQIAAHGQDLSLAYCAGLLREGRFDPGLIGDKHLTRALVYKPLVSPDARQFLRLLNELERQRIGVGPNKWEAGNQASRHNILATELGLRIAEFCKVAGVVGESISTAAHLSLAPASVPKRLRRLVADLAVTRNDGLRIAIELTASTNGKFDRKVEGWLDYLCTLDQTRHANVIVLFVEAAAPDHYSDKIHRAIGRALARAYKAQPAGQRATLMNRVAVARWREWFPKLQMAHTDLATLTAKAVDRSEDIHDWDTISLLDPQQSPFDTGAEMDAYAALEELSLYYGMPHWLRNESWAHTAFRHRVRRQMESMRNGT